MSRLRSIAVVSTAISLALMQSASASAVESTAQSADLTYECKFPVVGSAPISVTVEADVPATSPVGELTAPFPIRLAATGAADAFSQGNAATIEGSVAATFNVRSSYDDSLTEHVTNFKLDRWTKNAGTPLVLNGSGMLPRFPVVQGWLSSIEAGKLVFNLRATTADGEPIVLPPLTTDLNGNPVSGQDADPATTGIHCNVQNDGNLTIATLVGDGACWETEGSCPIPRMPFDVRGSAAGAYGGVVTWMRAGDPTVAGYAVALEGRDAQMVGSTDSFRFSDLEPETTYRGSVRSVSKDPAAPQSPAAEFSITTPAAGPPSDPSPLRVVTATTTSVTLAWNAVTSPSPIGEYVVSNIESEGPWAGESQSKTTKATTFTWTGLKPGNRYLFQVEVGNQALETAKTQQLSVTTPVIDPLPTAYGIQGTTVLPTLAKTDTAVSGSLVTESSITNPGGFSGTLALNKATTRLLTIGSWLPMTGQLIFASAAPATGKLEGNVLTLKLKVRIKVGSLRAYGAIPIYGGNDCQTRQLSDLTLTSDAAGFNAATGGTLTGTFRISDLNGCNPLAWLISPQTASDANAITLKLKPMQHQLG